MPHDVPAALQQKATDSTGGARFIVEASRQPPAEPIRATPECPHRDTKQEPCDDGLEGPYKKGRTCVMNLIIFDGLLDSRRISTRKFVLRYPGRLGVYFSHCHNHGRAAQNVGHFFGWNGPDCDLAVETLIGKPDYPVLDLGSSIFGGELA